MFYLLRYSKWENNTCVGKTQNIHTNFRIVSTFGKESYGIKLSEDDQMALVFSFIPYYLFFLIIKDPIIIKSLFLLYIIVGYKGFSCIFPLNFLNI